MKNQKNTLSTYMDAEYEDVKKLPDTIRKQYEDFFSSAINKLFKTKTNF